jgi:tRNA A-37 threonylcarbamoyl transferase component Bud32
MALFLEYFPNMKHLGLYNLTVDVANAALSILTRIHEAHILHNDFVPRNILVSHSGRVVIVCVAPYFILCGLISLHI